MYEIKIFENPDFGQVRTTTGENGTPFFCAVDVCRALGYGNSREALRKHVMEDDVTKRDTIDSLGRKQYNWKIKKLRNPTMPILSLSPLSPLTSQKIKTL